MNQNVIDPVLFPAAPEEIREVEMTEEGLSVEEFIAVARFGAKLTFSASYEERVRRIRGHIERFLAENRRIYGVTTGFGENVRYIIPPEEAKQLQYNIIHSHSCSVGEPLSIEQARALMLMQISNIGGGHSGVTIELISLIRDMLNSGVTPWAPGEGSVGYLGVEGHFARVYIGCGKAYYQGKLMDGGEALAASGLTPWTPGCKEGLCLLNGFTSVTALAILALYDAVNAAKSLDVISALSYEALEGTIKGCDPRLHAAKDHVEQQRTADTLVRMTHKSQIMEHFMDVRTQDPYIIRCTPHLHGAGKRMLRQSAQNIIEEMHSTSDNPIIVEDGDDAVALMGGNFDGSFVGGAADMIAIACGMLAKTTERRSDRMVNRFLNNDLPAFLAKDAGLNNGYMIPQYTAAGLVSEIRILAHPASIDSVPTCASQEDPVSMAYTASMKAGKAAKKLNYLAAIELMIACQALDCRTDGLFPGEGTLAIYEAARKIVPTVDEDRYYGDDQEKLFHWIYSGSLFRLAEQEIGTIEF